MLWFLLNAGSNVPQTVQGRILMEMDNPASTCCIKSGAYIDTANNATSQPPRVTHKHAKQQPTAFLQTNCCWNIPAGGAKRRMGPLCLRRNREKVAPGLRQESPVYRPNMPVQPAVWEVSRHNFWFWECNFGLFGVMRFFFVCNPSGCKSPGPQVLNSLTTMRQDEVMNMQTWKNGCEQNAKLHHGLRPPNECRK